MLSRGHIAAFAALILALSGCGASSGGPKAAASSTGTLPDPKVALSASVAALDELNYEFAVATAYDGTVSGVVHAPSGTLELQHRIKFSASDVFDVRYRRVGGAQWLRLDFSGTEGLPDDLPGVLTGEKWLPAARLTDGTRFGSLRLAGPEKGLTGAEGVVAGLVTVTRKGTATFEGTVDVTGAAPGVLRLGLEKEHLAALGDRAASLPFAATTDSKGRLRQFGFEYPAAGEYAAGGVSYSFERYGTARPSGAPVGSQLGSEAEAKEAADALRAIQER